MTDPVNPRDAPPAHASERIKAFIGDIARPFAIISTSFAAAWATIVIASKVENGNDGAIFAGAYFLGVASLYGAAADFMTRARRWLPAFNRALRQPALNKATPGN